MKEAVEQTASAVILNAAIEVAKQAKADALLVYVDQCDDKNPIDGWHTAADAAIGYVATLEDHPLRMAELNALNECGFTVRELKGGLEAVETN